MHRPYQSQPHLAMPATTTTTTNTATVKGARAGHGFGYGSALGFPTIHPSSHRRQQQEQPKLQHQQSNNRPSLSQHQEHNSQHLKGKSNNSHHHNHNHHNHHNHHNNHSRLTQSFADRPRPTVGVHAGPVPKAATASPDIGRGYDWSANNNYSHNYNGNMHRRASISHHQQHQQQYQHHHQQHHQQQQHHPLQKQQPHPLQKQHLSYPLSKREYRNNYQYHNQDHYGYNGYAAGHGYTAVESQWNELSAPAQEEAAAPDFTYYLQKLLQIPDMLDHEHYVQQPYTSSMQDMGGWNQQQRWSHSKKAVFAEPMATVADVAPMSSADPVALLSCIPYKSCLRVGLSAQQQQQQLAYLAEHDHYSRNHHHKHCYDYDYNRSQNQHHHHHDQCYDNSADGDCCRHHSHEYDNSNMNTYSSSSSSLCYEQAVGSGRRRRKSADYGVPLPAIDGSAKPHKQYRYDDRFSLSMEHLPLYNQSLT